MHIVDDDPALAPDSPRSDGIHPEMKFTLRQKVSNPNSLRFSLLVPTVGSAEPVVCACPQSGTWAPHSHCNVASLRVRFLLTWKRL